MLIARLRYTFGMKRVLLHNIRSAHNVGSIFRTADGAGVDQIYISGYTPRPIDRFGRAQPEIEKTSLGACTVVPWEDLGGDPSAKVAELKQDGVAIVAVEQHPRSVSIYDFHPPERALYVFGSEIEGVPNELLEMADTIVEIPMVGEKESLNVSVAAGIVLFWRA